MNKLFLFLAFCFITFSGFSQAEATSTTNKKMISIGSAGRNFLAPSSGGQDFQVFGGFVGFDYGINKNIALGLDAEITFGKNSYRNIGIQPGVKYYFKETFDGFYVGTDLSFDFGSTEVNNVTSTRTDFIAGLKVGYDFKINEKFRIGLSPKFFRSIPFDSNYDGQWGFGGNLRVGYVF
ncbi:MAG: DUF3575 domain-containing protein [Chitinophagales bacterium]|jgi:hypothetical protein|nr:DUF3575 domain-containing protein [Chitinophagales bacterium]